MEEWFNHNIKHGHENCDFNVVLLKFKQTFGLDFHFMLDGFN